MVHFVPEGDITGEEQLIAECIVRSKGVHLDSIGVTVMTCGIGVRSTNAAPRNVDENLPVRKPVVNDQMADWLYWALASSSRAWRAGVPGVPGSAVIRPLVRIRLLPTSPKGLTLSYERETSRAG